MDSDRSLMSEHVTPLELFGPARLTRGRKEISFYKNSLVIKISCFTWETRGQFGLQCPQLTVGPVLVIWTLVCLSTYNIFTWNVCVKLSTFIGFVYFCWAPWFVVWIFICDTSNVCDIFIHPRQNTIFSTNSLTCRNSY